MAQNNYCMAGVLVAALAEPKVDGGGAARDHDVLRCQWDANANSKDSQQQVNAKSMGSVESRPTLTVSQCDINDMSSSSSSSDSSSRSSSSSSSS